MARVGPVAVVKVGTSSIAKESGELDDDALTKLAETEREPKPQDEAMRILRGRRPAFLWFGQSESRLDSSYPVSGEWPQSLLIRPADGGKVQRMYTSQSSLWLAAQRRVSKDHARLE